MTTKSLRPAREAYDNAPPYESPIMFAHQVTQASTDQDQAAACLAFGACVLTFD